MGNGPIDLCKMCLKIRELQDSHLLPAAVYRKLRSKLLRDPDNPNSDPISVSGRRARQTSKQTTDYLLCSDCEGILDQMGEKYFLPLLANELGFPFQDVLCSFAPDVAEPDLYACARNSSIDCDKIAHFASGIFWKAAVHAWVHVDSTVKIELRGYEQGLREYLLGAQPFPNGVTLVVLALPPNVPLLSAVAPIQTREPSFDMYWFYVPGIQFFLFAGERTPPEIAYLCFIRNPLHPVIVDPTAVLSLARLYRESLSTAQKSARPPYSRKHASGADNDGFPRTFASVHALCPGSAMAELN
jgi:hypothetical protein